MKTNDKTNAVTTAKRPVLRHLIRRALAGLLAVVAALTLVVAGVASPASAATPQYTPVTCGWYIQSQASGSFADMKVSWAGLPWVSGTSSTSQLVWTYVEFQHRRSTGPVTYRTAWYSASARAGVWTKTWTAYANGATNQVFVHDAGGAGESGYTAAESPTEDVVVRLSIYWMRGITGTTLSSVQIYAAAVNNANHNLVCNGGSNTY